MRAFKLEEISELQNRRTVSEPTVEPGLDRLGWLMDDLFRIPVLGWRFGLDAIIGLIPGFGDTATSIVSFYILASAVRYRVPKITLLRMGFNIAIDYLVGSLPLVGDVADAWFKSNKLNLALLKRRATVSAAEAREASIGDWIFVGAIILGLVGLALVSAFVSIYLLVRLTSFVAGNS
jgi:hypothetical protein